MTDPEKMGDRWSSTDYPVLLAAARIFEGGGFRVDAGQVCERTGLDENDVNRALGSLIGAHPPFLTGESDDRMAGPRGWFASELTERGRRAVGLWPNGDNVDALVESLNAAAADTPDLDERSRLRKVAAAIGGVSKDVMVEVAAAWAAKLSGV